MHAPVFGSQHAWTHVVGVHAPPAGPQIPPRQPDCVVMKHVVEPAVQHGPQGGQGLGWQAVPGTTGLEPGGHDAPPKTWKQPQLPGLQHAWMHGLGVQEVPLNHTPGQFAWNEMMQTVEPLMQQMPSGGQGLGVHELPGTLIEPVGHVSVAPITLHPVAVQQTCTHGFGLHVPPAIHWPLQPAWGVVEHRMVPGMQHAPKGGQGLGVQEVKLPNHPVGQFVVPPKVWHAPFWALQHVTLGGKQLFTDAHVLPTPCQAPPIAVHAACDCTRVQVGSPAAFTVQHAPHVGTQTTGGRQVAPAV